MKPAILIHGPTASGKTALAIEVARRLGGEVINADSMQVYRDLQVISARPTEEEMGGVAHHLFGHVDAAARYSTGQWLEEARATIRDLELRGKRAVLVGGTGLYLLAMTQGLSNIPPVPEDVRADVRAIADAEGAEGLRARLEPVDPVTAERLGTGDRQRLARAYEVYLATGKPITDYQKTRQPPVLQDNEWMGVALTPPRAKLYQKIDRRFEGMLMQGAMEEARQLIKRDLDPELPAMKAHGMPWLAAFARGEITAEFAAENAKRDTRRYAKRQFTWIGRQFPFWPRIPSPDPEDRLRVILALYREIDRPVEADYS
ncbi:MAG: tRNA (adenosine(37)-N6)-dimethylallyltransferase MiaA [Hyphomonas sp.]|nr:tRNA (adenosine(37)-N6)-dimethylallyltransferase MiaA [Hyphomonas sp.]